MEVYEVLQSGLVKEILEITASYFPVLEEVNGVVAALDVLASFAHVSSYAPTPYTRPKFSNGKKKLGYFNLRRP